VYALYLSVAFFFSLFSFGTVFANIVPIQITPLIKDLATDEFCIEAGTYTGLDQSTGTYGRKWVYFTTAQLDPLLPLSSLTYDDLSPWTSPIATELSGTGNLGYTNGVLDSELCVAMNDMTAGTYASGGTGYIVAYFYNTTETDDPMYSYAYAYYSGGVITPSEAIDQSDVTRWITNTPTPEQTVINPNVTISSTWYVSNDDIERLTTIFGGPAGKIRYSFQILPAVESPSWSYQGGSYVLPTGYETASSTTLLFNGSIPHLNYGENYKVKFTLFGANYYNLFGPAWTIEKTIYFSVGTTTESGFVEQSIASSTQARIDEQFFSSGYSREACTPLSGEFSIVDCILLLFIPDADYTAQKVGELTNTVTNSWPIGYITDFVQIISTTTVGTLIPIDAVIPAGIPGAGSTVTLDLTNVLDPLLNASTSSFVNSSAPSTETFFEITNHYWEIVCYLLAVLYIIGRVMGSHIFGHTGKHATVKTT